MSEQRPPGAGRNARKTKPIDRVRNRVVASVKEAESRARQSERKRARASLYVWRLCAQVFRQWQQDRCPQQAASLSFQLLLSIVPALAVVLATFHATGAMSAKSTVVSFLTTELIPLSAEEVSSKLLAWSSNINVASMGIVGFITVVFIAFVTFNSMDQCISLIWRVEKRRSLPKRLVTFYLTATVGPLVFGLSLYPAAQFGLTDGWSGALFSSIISFCGLFLANFFLPNTPVRARAALAGAAVNTVAFELAKLGFAAYVGSFAMDKYAGIYGTVAIVPLSLVWIYWSWLMFLLGVEVTHIVQNYHLLESERRSVVSLRNEYEARVNANTALRFCVTLARSQASAGTGCSRFRLGTDFAMSDDAVRAVLQRLQRSELVAPNRHDDQWALTRAAADISVQDVFDAFAGPGQTHRIEDLGDSAVEQALAELLTESRRPLEECSIDELLITSIAPTLDEAASEPVPKQGPKHAPS